MGYRKRLDIWLARSERERDLLNAACLLVMALEHYDRDHDGEVLRVEAGRALEDLLKYSDGRRASDAS